MLSRYEKKDGFWAVPETGHGIFVTKEGLVCGKRSRIINSSISANGDLVVEIPWYDGYRHYKVAELIARTFKPTWVPVIDWALMNLLYKDGNKLNVHASNLIWKFTTPIESRKFKGFYFIPGFTRFLINLNCDAIDAVNGAYRTRHYKNDYFFFSVKPDIGYWAVVGGHRLICLAFKDYSAAVNELDVNHINGIPGDNQLENLEFVTRGENNRHAIRTGLRICKPPSKRTPVLIRHIKTGIVTEHRSKFAAATSLGISIATITKHLKEEGTPVFVGDVQMKLKNDRRPWDSNIDLNAIVYHETHARRVKATNLSTNEVSIFEAMTDCAHALGVSKDTVAWRLKNSKYPVIGNYELQFLNHSKQN